MKTITPLLFVAFLSFVSHAQDPELLDNNWYVDYIVVDGVTHDSPIPGFPLVNTNLDFYSDNCAAILDPESDSFFADISYDPVLDEFTMTNMGITLPGCYNYCNFAPFYWDLLFENGIESHFTYQITTNPDSSKGLQIIHDDGDIGFYNNFPPLGIADEEKLNAVVYPNPVSDIVNIVSDNINIESYQIFDVTGKAVIPWSSFETSIDISHLNQGIYFLEVASNAAKGIYKLLKK